MDKISMETELDKNIDALALTRAKCDYYLAHGQCKSCANCDIRTAYDFGMANMQPVDKLRVYNQAAKYYNDMTYNKARSFSSVRELMKFVGRFVTIMVIIFIIPSVIALCSSNYPMDTKQEDLTVDDQVIIETCLQQTADTLYDTNKDGLINCIDYSIVFVERYRELTTYADRDRCEIVRNVNKATGMNHLFIRYKSENKYIGWICIEPQGNEYNYTMSGYWGTMYDKRYNYYGETAWWMSQRR